MDENIILKPLSTKEEADLLNVEFSKQFRWYSPGDYYDNCLLEIMEGKRVTLMAFYEGDLAGCCHLIFESLYPYFRSEQIPEINDLNVFPKFRRKKIASRLLDELEKIASMRSQFVGLGVGLYEDYGNAQRMYGKRGYVMDGRGITYKNIQVQPGQSVTVDDDLLLYLVKSCSS